MIGKTHRQVSKVFRELEILYLWCSIGFSDDHRRRTIDCASGHYWAVVPVWAVIGLSCNHCAH